MPKPVENSSSNIIDLLKDRFEIADSIDERGEFTDNPEEIKVFSFNYINKAGEDKGSVVVSMLDDNESRNSIKIYFGEDLANADADTKKEWYDFLQDIRQFAKIHLLGFDVRNINKNTITRRDVEKDLKLTEADLLPMFESSFGPIDGSVKTSKQPLGSMQIIIKHSDRVNPNIKNSRSRKIEKIYLSNNKGERFLLPFKSLMAARAMARHIESGGTPYDNVGASICQLIDEMTVLNRFFRFVKHKNLEGSKEDKALMALRERYNEIKKQLSRLTSKSGYAKFHSSIPVDAGEIEEDEINEDIFNDIELDDESQLAIPYVHRAYNKFRQSDEENEFNNWINAAKGEGEGQDIIMDNGIDEEFTSNEDQDENRENNWAESKSFRDNSECPACSSNIITSDGIGNYNCKNCRYKWNENDTEYGHDDSQECLDDYYFNESKTAKPSCPKCGSKKYSLMPTDFETAKCKDCGKNWNHGIVKGINDPCEDVNETKEQVRQGKLAGQRDKQVLKQQEKQDENVQPYELGGMNGSIPSPDAPSGEGGMSYLESMKLFKSIVETNESNWSPCREYGHIWKDDNGKVSIKCKDCGAKRPKEDVPFEAQDFERSTIRSNDTTNTDPDNRTKQYTSMSGSSTEGKKNTGKALNESTPSNSIVDDLLNEYQSEYQLNELFGFGKKKDSAEEAQKQLTSMRYFLEFLGFEKVDDTHWVNRYFKVYASITNMYNGSPQMHWEISRNGRVAGHGIGVVDFGKEIFKHEEFRDYRKDFLKMFDKLVTEADVPSGAGFSSPLTTPQIDLGRKFHTSKEINKHRTTNGKLSPFSLISCPDKDVDENDEEIQTMTNLGRGVCNTDSTGSANSLNPPNL